MNKNIGTFPDLTVVIPTRNREHQLTQALDSILDTTSTLGVEVHVVDQSTGGATAQAIVPYLARMPLVYTHTATQGVARARNIGAREARTDVIAFMDDDCTATPTWIAAIAQTFAQMPQLALLFGNVKPGTYDAKSEFLISYDRKGERSAYAMRQKHTIEGIAGCMALRKSAWIDLGGFDEMLGTGGRFRAGEEIDFTLRALQVGKFVHETDKIAVFHHGARKQADKGKIAYDYLYGIGAVYSKHLKCGRWSVLLPLAQLAARWAFFAPVVQYSTPLSKVVRLQGFAHGFIAGLKTPVYAQAGLYSQEYKDKDPRVFSSS